MVIAVENTSFVIQITVRNDGFINIEVMLNAPKKQCFIFTVKPMIKLILTH